MRPQTFRALEKEAYQRKELLESFSSIDPVGKVMCTPELIQDYIIEGGEHYPDDRRLGARYRHYTQWIATSSKVYRALTDQETREYFVNGLADILHTGILGGASRICYSNNVMEVIASRITDMQGMEKEDLAEEMKYLKIWVSRPHEGLAGADDKMLEVNIFEESERYIKQIVKETEESQYITKLLNTLLEVALQLTGADCGSIMLLDKASNRLSIKMSKGLKAEDIKDVSVKMGEGIAGWVAEEQQPLFIDDKTEDTRIKNRLTKPWLKSSIVVPLRVGLEGDSFGVMNVSSSKESEKLTPESAQLLYKLSGMMSAPVTGLVQDEIEN